MEEIKKFKKLNATRRAADVHYINSILKSGRKAEANFVRKFIPILPTLLKSLFDPPKFYDRSKGFPRDLMSVTGADFVNQ